MSEYIVISREYLVDGLFNAFKLGHDTARAGYLATDPEGDYKKFVASLPTGWRPIAEAPKDGTWVLVASHSKGEYPEWLYEQCVWVAEQQDWYGSTDWRAVGKPTHFLPLIEPTEK